VFADSIRTCVFDGQLMRVEFTVARFDDPGVLGILEGRQVPVCRLVLNRTALADDPNGKPLTAELLRESNQARIAATAPAIACASSTGSEHRSPTQTNAAPAGAALILARAG